MYCIKCGSKLEEDEAFCANCGAQTKAVELLHEKKKFPKKIIFCAAVIFLAAVSVVGLKNNFLNVENDSSGIGLHDEDFLSVENDSSEIVLRDENYYEFFSDVLEEEVIKGFYDQSGNVNFVEYSGYRVNGTPEVEDICFSGSSACVSYLLNGKLFLLKDNKVSNIAVGGEGAYVSQSADRSGDSMQSQKLSFDGGTVAFCYEDYLYVYYQGLSSADTKVAEVVNGKYVLSPNGEYILYVNKNDNMLYLAAVGRGNQGKKIADHVEAPLAVSDSGKDVFYIGYDSRLYYTDGKVVKCLSQNSIEDTETTRDIQEFHFNVSCDEIIYQDGDVTYYYKAGDAQSRSIGKDIGSVDLVYTNKLAVQKSSEYKTSKFRYFMQINGKDTFANMIFCNIQNDDYYIYYWLNADGTELDEIVSLEWSAWAVSTDFQNLIYFKDDNNLYQFNTERMEERCIYSVDDVLRIFVSPDFKHLYITTQYDKIKYINLERGDEVREVAQMPENFYGEYNEQQQAYILCTENNVLYKVTPQGMKLLLTGARDATISWLGAVTYDVYDEEGNEHRAMLLKDESSKVLY